METDVPPQDFQRKCLMKILKVGIQYNVVYSLLKIHLDGNSVIFRVTRRHIYVSHKKMGKNSERRIRQIYLA